MNVKIPGASASRSKMAKKDWKCWAIRLTEVSSGGMPFVGDRLETWATVDMNAGDVVLHVDDSSTHGVGVVLAGPDGDGVISWIATSGAAPSTLTSPAKKLLAMTPAERIVAGAKLYMSDHEEMTQEQLSHYMVMSDMAESAPPVDLSAVSTDALIRELASRGITA